MQHPIVQSRLKQIEEEAKQKAVKELKEKVPFERWHALVLLIALSLISAIFRAQIMWFSFFLGLALCLDTYLQLKFKSSVGTSVVSAKDDVIVDLGGEE